MEGLKLAVLINNLASCYNLQGCCLNNAWTTLLLCLSSIVRKMLKTLGGARGLGIRVWVRIRYRYRMTSAIDHRPGHSNPCIVRTSGRVEKWAREKAGEMPLLSGFSSHPLFVPPAFPPACKKFLPSVFLAPSFSTRLETNLSRNNKKTYLEQVYGTDIALTLATSWGGREGGGGGGGGEGEKK